jgi:hypothetical protein
MSGLTRLGKDILDFYDSGECVDLIATVLNVSTDDVRTVVREYDGTGDRHDFLDDLLPERLLPWAPTDGRI